MSTLAGWIRDRNDDGHAGDLAGRICLDLDSGSADRNFWSLLLDICATAGVHVSAPCRLASLAAGRRSR